MVIEFSCWAEHICVKWNTAEISIHASYHSVRAIIRKLWKSVFSEGVHHFERQFQVDGDVARNRSMDRWIGE